MICFVRYDFDEHCLSAMLFGSGLYQWNGPWAVGL